jgi:pimeloyl-ACP methyl ester carboxylesterase
VTPTIVLVHGACHDAESWDALRSELTALGRTSVAIKLPSSGHDIANLGDMYADATAIRSLVDSLDDVVVVCHSYGGVPTTRALAGASNVRGIVYLAAFMPDENETLIDLSVEDYGDWTIRDDESTISATDPADMFYNLCTAETADAAIARLVPQALVAFDQAPEVAAWRDIPSSYIVCSFDRAIPPEREREMAERAGAVYALPADHSPFLSMPKQTADLLLEII